MGRKSDARRFRKGEKSEKRRDGGVVIRATLKEQINGSNLNLVQILGKTVSAIEKSSGFNIKRFSVGNTDLTKVENALRKLEELGYIIKERGGHYNAPQNADADSLRALLYVVKNDRSCTASQVATELGIDNDMVGSYLDELTGKDGPLALRDGKYSQKSGYW